jgi:hypothetical protein
VSGFAAGSFRDPDSGVSIVDGRVVRGFSAAGAARFDRLTATAFFPRLTAAGEVVGTTDYSGELPLSPRGVAWARAVEHERVPVVSYPYEWPFTMLQEAALLQLKVVQAALDEGMTLTDGTAYNVQFVGSRPVFIDIGSFAPASGPWAGYRQFCQTTLFPLMIQAHLGVPFQPLLRGSIDGLTASQVSALFSGLRRFRKGVLRNVVLHGLLERRVRTGSQAVSRELEASGFSTDVAKATVGNLAKLTRALQPRRRASTWADYRVTCSYTRADVDAKRGFVRSALESQRQRMVLDLGANDGEYSRLAARHSDHVVAVDGDEAVIDALYRDLRGERDEQILPLVVDLADPPGGLGWRNHERAPFSERVQPDVVLALALVHHLVIAASVPIPEVVRWLRSFDARAVVELVEANDVQVQRLLANKPPGLFADYTRPNVERLLAEVFDIVGQETLPSGTRTLYLLDPRRTGGG